MKTKKSYGIAICRKTKKGVQIIMVKKRCSYHFTEFVSGKYKKNDNSYLSNLMSNMTCQEKVTIMGLKFAEIWRRVWLEDPEHKVNNKGKFSGPGYINKKIKFDSTFLKDSGEKLRNLLKHSKNAESPWEIPKGRRNSFEKCVDSAIREVYEETGISHAMYRLLWDIKPIIESHTDHGITYINEYYIAEIRPEYNDIEPSVQFEKSERLAEIEHVKWVCINELGFLRMPKNSLKRLKIMFSSVVKKYKLNSKANLIN
jgi:8-oxo-dGTP pyrophosphatase MutT (NUDIX family)